MPINRYSDGRHFFAFVRSGSTVVQCKAEDLGAASIRAVYADGQPTPEFYEGRFELSDWATARLSDPNIKSGIVLEAVPDMSGLLIFVYPDASFVVQAQDMRFRSVDKIEIPMSRSGNVMTEAPPSREEAARLRRQTAMWKARLLRHGVPWPAIVMMSSDDRRDLADALLTQEIEAVQRSTAARHRPESAQRDPQFERSEIGVVA